MVRRVACRGVALLMALILMALATVAAVAIGYNAGLFASRSRGLYTQAEGLRIGQGAEAVAAYILRQDGAQNKTDSLDEAWAKPYGPFTLDDGVVVEFAMEDLQGRFNLNNLINPDGTDNTEGGQEFEQLLVMLGLETRWRGLITDWIDADDLPSTPDGAEDSAYNGLSPAYRAPNLPISSVTELLAMPQMTRAVYDKLTPFIAALPPGRQVNLCTASAELLDALQGQQSYALDKQGLAEQRKKGCFPTVAVYNTSLNPQAQSALNQPHRIGEQSEYFRLRSWITIGTTRFTLYSLINRNGSGNQPGGMQLRTVLRTFGTE